MRSSKLTKRIYSIIKKFSIIFRTLKRNIGLIKIKKKAYKMNRVFKKKLKILNRNYLRKR